MPDIYLMDIEIQTFVLMHVKYINSHIQKNESCMYIYTMKCAYLQIKF